MSGLFPLVVMYSRVLELLEQRPKQLALDRLAYREANPTEWYQVPATPAAPNSGEWVHKWYLVPFSDSDIAAKASDAWARKLGASASIKHKSPTGTSEVLLAEPTKPTDTELAGLDAGVATYYKELPEPSDPDHPWIPVDGVYYNAQAHQSPPGATSTPTATWTFTGVTAGWYRIEATGLVSPGPLPMDCFYKFSSDSGATWSDSITPNLTFGQSARWELLAIRYFSSSDVMIQLTTGTNSNAIADGMRIVRCSVQIKSLTLPTAETGTATVEIKPALRP